MRKIKINDFSINIHSNGYWIGFVLIRNLKLSEALYIADKGLGVNVELIKEDWESRIEDEKEEIIDEKEEFRTDIQGIITGETTWDYFTNRWTCDEGLEDINAAMFVQMLYICDKKGLIK